MSKSKLNGPLQYAFYSISLSINIDLSISPLNDNLLSVKLKSHSYSTPPTYNRLVISLMNQLKCTTKNERPTNSSEY